MAYSGQPATTGFADQEKTARRSSSVHESGHQAAFGLLALYDIPPVLLEYQQHDHHSILHYKYSRIACATPCPSTLQTPQTPFKKRAKLPKPLQQPYLNRNTALNFQASTCPTQAPNFSLVIPSPSAEPRQVVFSATRLADAPSPPQTLRFRRGICTVGIFLLGDTGQ